MIRVMHIDDHPVVRAGLRTILDSFADITVVAEGATGQAAVDTVVAAEAAEKVDVVVMDIQLPGMDGITAARKLSEAGGPPVLILTTYDTEADIVAAIEAGALGYLLKDAPEPMLRDAVIATAEGRRPLFPEVAAAMMERVGKPHQALSAREIEILQALSTGHRIKNWPKRCSFPRRR